MGRPLGSKNSATPRPVIGEYYCCACGCLICARRGELHAVTLLHFESGACAVRVECWCPRCNRWGGALRFQTPPALRVGRLVREIPA